MMNSRGRNRRSKPYFTSNYQKKQKLDRFLRPGLKGFICTCNNGDEKACVRDSYNILHEYGDRLKVEEIEQPKSKAPTNDEEDKKPKTEEENSDDKKPKTEEKNDDDKKPKAEEDNDDDEMDEFQKEVDALKSERERSVSRFRAVDSGVANCLFIQTTNSSSSLPVLSAPQLPDPIGLAETIMRDLAETKQLKARFLLRMIPIEVTCRADMNVIIQEAKPLIEKYFRTDPVTYAIYVTKRCNSSVDRDVVIEKLATMVQECNSEHKVNLTTPTLSIMIEAMRGICGLAVIRDYCQLSKYNLRLICGLPLNEPGPSKKKVESTSEPSQASGDVAENMSSAAGEGDQVVGEGTASTNAESVSKEDD